MLPYAAYTIVKIRCPHCQKDTSRMRSAVSIGATHKCPFCNKSFRIAALLPVTTPRARR